MMYRFFVPLVLMVSTNFAQSAMVINLSNASGGGLRVQMSGSANFSTLGLNGTFDSPLEFTVGSTTLRVGNEHDGTSDPGVNTIQFGSTGVDTSQVDRTFEFLDFSDLEGGAIPAFGYSGGSVFWDDDYINDALLNIDEVLPGVTASEFIGFGSSAKTSTITWDGGNESMTFIVTTIPEPSSSFLAIAGLVMGLVRRRRQHS